ncbi:MAG TPA: DUF2975 domain-containing protein [Bacillota bacterium]|nr:DUF2975 domain-containing protein [Bacillota bacterium]
MESTFNKERFHGVIGIVYTILKWIIRFGYLVAGITVIGFLVVLFIPKDLLDFNMANLEHINVQFTNIMYQINGGFFTGIVNIKSLLLLLLFAGMINLGFYLFIMIHIKKLVGSVRNNVPFEKSNAIILRNLGIGYLIACVLVSVVNSWLMVSAVNTFDVINTTVNFSIDLQYVFIGVIILILAYVFSYGSYLQQEHDTTI